MECRGGGHLSYNRRNTNHHDLFFPITFRFCWGGGTSYLPQHPALNERRTHSYTSVERIQSPDSRSRSSSYNSFGERSDGMTPTSSKPPHSGTFPPESVGTGTAGPMTIPTKRGSCTPSPIDTPIGSPSRTLRTMIA